MAPLADETNPYVARFTDAILSNSALRDNLEDDDAQLLIDWGLAQAERVGITIQSEDDAENKQRALNRLIKYVGRYTARRHEKDEAWPKEILERLNEYSQGIGGRIPTEEEMVILLSHQNLSNADLLEKIFAFYGISPKNDNNNPSEKR